MVVRQDCDKTRLKLTDEFWIKCDRLLISNILYNIATTSLFNAIDREAKELLPRSIFIITRHYKRVKIQ
jgi:thymidylate kinase